MKGAEIVKQVKLCLVSMFLVVVANVAAAGAEHDSPQGEPQITLRAAEVPKVQGTSSRTVFRTARVQQFRKKFPNINPVFPGGLEFGGNEYTILMEVIPLMQIASGVQADVMWVWVANMDTYVRQGFFYPFDKYLEKELGLDIPDGHLLDTEAYFGRLQESDKYESELEIRIPKQLWSVMRRPCPYGEQCSYCIEWQVETSEKHYHLWAMPVRVYIRTLWYRRELFKEAGLPDRAPETLEELLEFARKLTDPDEGRFGMRMDMARLQSSAEMFLGSFGARMVEEDEDGNLRCVYDSEAAVEACYLLCRFFYEPFTNPKGKRLKSVVFPEASVEDIAFPSWRGGVAKIGMFADFCDYTHFLSWRTATQFGLDAWPKGPGGIRGGRMGAELFGISADITDKKKLDAAWKWVWFSYSLEARKLFARSYVELGIGNYVQPKLLIEGGFETYVKQVPAQWVSGYDEAMKTSPVPAVGKNIRMLERSFSKAIDHMWTSKEVQQAVADKDATLAKKLIREILTARAEETNAIVLRRLTPKEEKFRARVALGTAIAIFVVFALVFRKVFKTFAASQVHDINHPKGTWQFGRYKWAYILLIPAVGSIALWSYYPLVRGTAMVFQDYKIRGGSEWVGMRNFGDVLFDQAFRYSLWVSLKYVFMYALVGFTAPIILAFMLTELRRGKVFFRTVYYLPAVLSGVVVMFLWKGFYAQYGMINETLNFFIGLLNTIPGVAFEEIHKQWLREPAVALFFVLLPVIWVGVGPGCLIYLAALKTVPEELYEAADMDGAGIFQKVFHIAIPSIKGLIMINFIGVMVAQMKGGSEFVLAMTQGGPYTPYGQTEVVGLHIYWEAFGFLQFGTATAMAWMVGAMLVGFTVFQMQKLSKMEFRTAAGVK